MRLTAVVALFPDLRETELLAWVERGWVHPQPSDRDWEFQEIDVARVRLIHDLRRDMAVQEEVMPLVLSLLDQVYELRSTLKTVLRILEAQPADVRTAVLEALRPRVP